MRKKNSLFTIVYVPILMIFTLYIILDTLVISKGYTKVETSKKEVTSAETGKVSSTDKTYEDDNIKITISEYTVENTQVYVADVELKNSSYLQTAFANNTYGKNVTAKTSTTAEQVGAILAINGDYYGVQESGYVLKNGTIYRNTAKSNQEDLVIYEDGSVEIINETDITLEELEKKGAYNLLSFGPALVENSEITVNSKTEVSGKSMASNPRTAIGLIDENHYVFVVSDGRTSESSGLSLYQLADFMKKKLNVKTAYNLDGGGSSTMYFNGKIINNPTTNGKISERSVSDIVYIGY